jgi:hypothetical protein
MQYSPFKVNRRFGGTCGLHLQGQRIRQLRNQREAHSKQSSFRGLHGVISQEIGLFITTAVKTSNLTIRLFSVSALNGSRTVQVISRAFLKSIFSELFRVEAGQNTSTVVLRVVEGDQKRGRYLKPPCPWWT